MAFANGMADGVHQVRLAESDAAVQEERVVRLARRVGDGPAGGVCKPGAVAHHERGEHEVGVEPRRVTAVGGRFSEPAVGGLGSVGEGFGLVGRRSGRRVDGDDHLAVARDEPADGFADDRRVALDEPVAGQASGHPDGERVAIAFNEDRVGQPCLVTGPRQLETQFLLRSLPDLLRLTRAGRRGIGGLGTHVHVAGSARCRQIIPLSCVAKADSPARQLCTGCAQEWISEPATHRRKNDGGAMSRNVARRSSEQSSNARTRSQRGARGRVGRSGQQGSLLYSGGLSDDRRHLRPPSGAPTPHRSSILPSAE